MARPAFGIETTVKTLAVGGVGGLVFSLLHLPLPWLSGCAMAVAAASLAGLKLGVAKPVREVAIVALGLSLGATVTPYTLSMLPRWPFTLAGLAGAMLTIMASGAWYLERFHKLDRASARLASMPGALNFVMTLAMESSADPRRVAIIQIVRITTILLALPLFVMLTGADVSGGVALPDPKPVKLPQLAFLALMGALGALVFNRLKTPAPSLFGAMLVGALLYGPGVLSSAVPGWIMVPVLAVLGSMIGANFAGADVRLFLEMAKAGVLSLILSVLVAAAWAFPLAKLTGLPPLQVWLAFAPGGVETTAILAIALGLDGAYVTSHHLVRVIILNSTVPMWIAPFMQRDEDSKPASSAHESEPAQR